MTDSSRRDPRGWTHLQRDIDVTITYVGKIPWYGRIECDFTTSDGHYGLVSFADAKYVQGIHPPHKTILRRGMLVHWLS